MASAIITTPIWLAHTYRSPPKIGCISRAPTISRTITAKPPKNTSAPSAQLRPCEAGDGSGISGEDGHGQASLFTDRGGHVFQFGQLQLRGKGLRSGTGNSIKVHLTNLAARLREII